jgi:oxygen-dependent protoporphyrinogen oxidase
MAGIYVASADELSLKATFPRFADLEREHRSLIKALRRMPPAAGNVSPFVSLRGGMKEFVDRLVERMAGVRFLEGKEAVGIEAGPPWRVRLPDGALEADDVVLAVPAHAAGKLWPGVPAVKYVTTCTVTLAYRKFRDLEGTGFVIPRTQNRKILACTWVSNKFEGRAPADHFMVRCFIKGDAPNPEEAAHAEMEELIGAKEKPVFSRVFRWPERNAVYEVGHERRIAEFEKTLPAGLHLCGSAFHGTGIPECVRDGRAVARRILASGA